MDRLLASPEFAVRWGRLLAAPLKPQDEDANDTWGGAAARAGAGGKDAEPRETRPDAKRGKGAKARGGNVGPGAKARGANDGSRVRGENAGGKAGGASARGSLLARAATLEGRAEVETLGVDVLGDEVVLVRSRVRREGEQLLCASVWQRVDGAWRVRFRQATPA